MVIAWVLCFSKLTFNKFFVYGKVIIIIPIVICSKIFTQTIEFMYSGSLKRKHFFRKFNYRGNLKHIA